MKITRILFNNYNNVHRFWWQCIGVNAASPLCKWIQKSPHSYEALLCKRCLRLLNRLEVLLPLDDTGRGSFRWCWAHSLQIASLGFLGYPTLLGMNLKCIHIADFTFGFDIKSLIDASLELVAMFIAPIILHSCFTFHVLTVHLWYLI